MNFRLKLFSADRHVLCIYHSPEGSGAVGPFKGSPDSFFGGRGGLSQPEGDNRRPRDGFDAEGVADSVWRAILRR